MHLSGWGFCRTCSDFTRIANDERERLKNLKPAKKAPPPKKKEKKPSSPELKEPEPCPEHATYGGIRKPRTGCEVCLEFYAAKRQYRIAKAQKKP